jgi:hypothetical protein
MTLELSDEQTAALLSELDRIIEGDRYPFSPRIRTLNEIRAMIKPYTAREPLPATNRYEPPSKGSVGFNQRLVISENSGGSMQRPFEEEPA